MSEITISAPGKVILHGEHAVVYGKCAIATSVDLRSILHIKPNDTQDLVRVSLPEINIQAAWRISDISSCLNLESRDAKKPVSATVDELRVLTNMANIDSTSSDTRKLALVAFLYLYSSIVHGKNLTPIDVEVNSLLPTGAGLGSSAGYSVCLAAGLLLYSQMIPQPHKTLTVGSATYKTWSDPNVLKLINDWAFQGENIIHGKCSGIDNAVSTYGGALKYQNKTILNLDKVPNIKILLVNTKVSRSTKVLVAGVRKKFDMFPSIIGPIFDSIEAISNECLKLFQEHCDSLDEHYDILSELISINQSHLNVLGVSHPSLEQIFVILKKYGLPCKLTGAGGGGCAFAVIDPKTTSETLDSVIQELSRMGYDSWITSIGGPGVYLHA